MSSDVQLPGKHPEFDEQYLGTSAKRCPWYIRPIANPDHSQDDFLHYIHEKIAPAIQEEFGSQECAKDLSYQRPFIRHVIYSIFNECIDTHTSVSTTDATLIKLQCILHSTSEEGALTMRNIDHPLFRKAKLVPGQSHERFPLHSIRATTKDARLASLLRGPSPMFKHSPTGPLAEMMRSKLVMILEPSFHLKKNEQLPEVRNKILMRVDQLDQERAAIRKAQGEWSKDETELGKATRKELAEILLEAWTDFVYETGGADDLKQMEDILSADLNAMSIRDAWNTHVLPLATEKNASLKQARITAMGELLMRAVQETVETREAENLRFIVDQFHDFLHKANVRIAHHPSLALAVLSQGVLFSPWEKVREEMGTPEGYVRPQES